MEAEQSNAVALFWIPIGAGGNGFVRGNGRLYEAYRARVEGRARLALVHSALEITANGERYVIENAWPSPDSDTASRGVVVEGPVGTRRAGRLRPLRCEVRRWRDGVIPDAAEAIGGPVVVGTAPDLARAVLDLVPAVPPLTWGRRPAGSSEMWNSNSVIAWLLVRAGVADADARLPRGARAPGWQTGVEVAERG